jgi:hypothetical protein
MHWAFPPAVPWPRFLRLLRQADPPRGWLEEAATLPELRKRPLLLRWVAQHPKAPAHLRSTLLARLPWRALAAIAQDAAAHPQARSQAVERLQSTWQGLTLGERRALAPLCPRQLWPQVWRVREAGVLRAFLNHPRLDLDHLIGLIQPPLHHAQLDALAGSRWLGMEPLAHQVLQAIDVGLCAEQDGLVLGHGAPWIKSLSPESRLLAAGRLAFPALRRACRTWAIPSGPEE